MTTLTAVDVQPEPLSEKDRTAPSQVGGEARESTSNDTPGVRHKASGSATVDSDSRGGGTKLCGKCGLNPALPRRRFINGKPYHTFRFCGRCEAIRKRNQKSSNSKYAKPTKNDWSNPKYRAGVALRTAIRKGLIIKPATCDNCLKATCARSLHAHHADYSRPFYVRFLCYRCHAAFHRRYK